MSFVGGLIPGGRSPGVDPRGLIMAAGIVSFHHLYMQSCSPVFGDNPQALASELSYIQVDKLRIAILYHIHQCRPCT